MSQEIINKSLQKTLFSPMTYDSLWSQFLESLSYEISNLRDEYSSIKNNWNIYNNDKDNVIRIANSFGYNPNLTINNTLFMAIKETESIPYRIRNKTTYNGYFLIFKQNKLIGDIFNYYHNGYKLIKAIDYEKTIENLNNSNHYSPFFGIVPIKNFSMIMDSDTIILDYLDKDGQEVYDYIDENGRIVNYDSTNVRKLRWFYLDQKINGSYWKLDTQYIKTPSSHLGIEYFPQHHYCSYIMSVGIAEENINTYEIEIPTKDINENISIEVNNETMNTTITFNESENKEYFQDDNGILDSENSYFDFNTNKIHLTFNEIPIGQEISIVYNVNTLMTKDYFFYFEHGMEYNRACPIIPHTGIFLTAEIASSHGSDFFYENNEGYTVPELKMKAITASALNRYVTLTEQSYLDFATDDYGQPTGNENYKLDNTIKWFLDSTATQNVPLINNIRYISCGNKKLNMVNEKNNNLFKQSNLILYYNLNTDDDSSIIRDISSNSLNCIVVGDKIKINGIIDKSLNFNGETYAYSTSYLTTSSSTNYSFGLWFNAIDKLNPQGIKTLFDSFIKIEYDYDNEKLIINSTNKFDCSKNTDYFLTLILDSSNEIVKVYINSNYINEFDFLISDTSTIINIGTNTSHESNFYGIIDNVWFLSKMITEDNIKYIYDNKISAISHIGNCIGRYELYEDEKFENENYILVQSYIKGMDVTNESVKFSEDSMPNYSYKTKFYPISPSYFELKFTNMMGKTITLNTNEKGQFYNSETTELITGGIDFDKGTWSLLKRTIKSKSQIKIDSPKKTLHGTSWDVINESDGSNKWYDLYEASTDSFSGEFTADYYDYDSSNEDSTLFIYTEDNDSEPKTKIFTYNNSSYYVTSNGNPNSTHIKIDSYIINNDPSGIHLFSSNNGKSLYHNIHDMIANEKKLNAYIDLGESSNTWLYSINEGNTMYLDTSCQLHPIKKWKKLNSEEYGYSIDDSSIIYSNLLFNNILDTSIYDWQNIGFPNKMQQIIKNTQINLELTLIESRIKYLNLYTTTYLRETNVKIGDYNQLIPNSIFLNYWIEENNELKKYTAVINETGGISGVNISSGHFDYITNALTITYTNPLQSDLVVTYDYYYNLELDISKPVIMNYKINKSSYVNEIGLEDENHELIAYMTFPDVKFNDIYNNVSAMFAIIKN